MSQAADRRKGLERPYPARPPDCVVIYGDGHPRYLTNIRSGRDRRMAEVQRRQGDRDAAGALAANAQTMANLQRALDAALEQIRERDLELAQQRDAIAFLGRVCGEQAALLDKAAPDVAANEEAAR